MPVASRVEAPLRFTSAPFLALTQIDMYRPKPDQIWPPPTSKHGDVHGAIWKADVHVAPRHYWHGRGAWLIQSRDLDPRDMVGEPTAEGPGPRLLGIVGDQLIVARGRGDYRDRTLDVHVALADAPHDPWRLCTLEWPEWAVGLGLTVWYQHVGPVLVGDEIVVLGDQGIVHASALDCELGFLPTPTKPTSLTPGSGRIAWRNGARWSIALDDYQRVLNLPYTGHADWAGDSLIIEEEGRLLRWTEDEVVALDFPGPAEPTRDRRWRSDGEVLWIYEPGQPLWRIDEQGFVGLDIDLEWPTEARAQAGALIWAVARPDRMDVFSTWPGSGLGLDRDYYSQLLAPAR